MLALLAFFSQVKRLELWLMTANWMAEMLLQRP